MKRLLFSFLFLALISTIYDLTSNIYVYAALPECDYNGNPTRPGGECENKVPFVHSTLDKYGATLYCPLTPAVKEKKEVCNASPSLVDAHTEGNITYGYADTTIFANFDNATMGGYGPDDAAWNSLTLDQLAMIYPYNGLADKPLSINKNTPKESFRTFWRLTSLNQQLNAKAAFFERFRKQNPPIFDSKFPYIAPAGTPKPSGTPTTPGENDIALANTPAEIVGPELAYFDIGGQQDVDNNVLTPNNFKGASAAVQVINLINESPYNPVSDPTTNISLRIAGIQPDTSISQIQSYANNLNNLAASGAFQPGTVVIFGNEVNSLDVEYIVPGAVKNSDADLRKAAQSYGAQYVAFAKSIDHSKFRVAPSPPDLYNGDWNPVPWVDEFNKYITANGGCSVTDTLVANVFDVASRVGTGNLDTWTYLESHICSGLKVERFGGWGSWPEESVAKQVEFLNNTPIPPQIKAATTLIVPNCNGNTVVGTEQFAKEWWYYVRGRVFKVDGTEVDPENCSSNLPANLSHFKISELIAKLPACLKKYPLPNHCSGDIVGSIKNLIGLDDSPERAYERLSADTKAMYDAFQPFDFDNTRGYIAVQYLPNVGSPLNPIPADVPASAVLAENLPYTLALDDILNSKESGIMNFISPKWMNNRRNGAANRTSDDYVGGINYKSGDLESNLAVESQDRFNYFSKLAKQVWLDTYIPNDMHDGPEGCFAQGGPVLEAPRTFPQRLPQQPPNSSTIPADGQKIGQKQYVPVQYQVNPADERCGEKDEFGNVIPGTGWLYTFDIWEGGARERSLTLPLVHWVARAIVTFSNPKQTDIARSISEPGTNGNFSLVANLIPAQANKTIAMPDVEVFHSQKQIPMLGPWIDYDATNPNGVSLKGVGGKGELTAAYMGRMGGTTEINLCSIRNFWLRPAGLQKGLVETCFDPSYLINATLPVPIESSTSGDLSAGSCQVKQHLFENSCNGQPCYSYIADQAVNTSCSGKGVINPALVIAIALNENGGLVSTLPNGNNPPNLPHFGCFAGDDSITRKTSCAVNTLHKCDQSDEDILKNYGYVAGFNAAPGAPLDATPLNQLMSLMGFCSSSSSSSTTPCFSVFVSEDEADNIRSRLLVTLPSQRQTWFNYYKGFLDDIAAKYNCSPLTP